LLQNIYYLARYQPFNKSLNVTDEAKAYLKGKTKDKRKKINVEEKKNNICERLFEFAVRVSEFLKILPYSPENKTIRTQLSKGACFSGAN
jgi:hypothetical protein